MRVLTRRSNDEVERLLAHWARIDDEAGRTAAERRRRVLESRGLPVRDYEFPEPANDWVHLDWMRPLRFVYRNIPVGIRRQIKKRLVK